MDLSDEWNFSVISKVYTLDYHRVSDNTLGKLTIRYPLRPVDSLRQFLPMIDTLSEPVGRAPEPRVPLSGDFQIQNKCHEKKFKWPKEIYRGNTLQK